MVKPDTLQSLPAYGNHAFQTKINGETKVMGKYTIVKYKCGRIFALVPFFFILSFSLLCDTIDLK